MNASSKMQDYRQYGDKWIQTFTGTGIGGVLPLDHPRPEHVNFITIAHHTACTNRFLGATKLPISIAQHQIQVADHVRPRLRPRALFHDGHESAVNDNSTPWKALIQSICGMPVISDIEGRHDDAIFSAAGFEPISAAEKDEIKHEDLRALMTERRDLCEKTPMPWIVDGFGAEPWPETIVAWPWWYAEFMFLQRIRDYCPALFSRHSTAFYARIGELRLLGPAEWERMAHFVAAVRA